MAYQLWELESRNCVAEFASRSEALAAVRAMTSGRGKDSVASLLLVKEDGDGDLEEIASGTALARLADSLPAEDDLVRQPARR
jgi:hypothetical protein